MPRSAKGGRAGPDRIEEIIAAARERAARVRPGGGERQEEVEKAKQAMLRLLSVRMRSRWELRSKLSGRRFSPRALDDALNDLERVGLVDDGKFARLFLESRLHRRPRSYRILRRELSSKGVPDEMIEEAVEELQREVSEEELARQALGPRMGRMKKMGPEQARARAARFLSGKGFARSVIEELLRDLQ